MAFTARQCFEGLLTELSKVNAPSMLLQDFNYFCNKAIRQYINKRYSIYDVSQQTTDDLRVLKATAILEPSKFTGENIILKTDSKLKEFITLGDGSSKLFGATYEVNLPLDYLHILNCICVYKLNKRHKCFDKGNYVQYAAKRLTADSWPIIINDFYNRPLPERPYYYIHHINKQVDLPTNPIPEVLLNSSLSDSTEGTDISNLYSYTLNENNEEEGISNLPRTITLKNISDISTVERETGVRYGNSSNVRMEIRCGQDSSTLELVGVLVDYIKSPLEIKLTLEQVNLIEDTSQIMEFPDYICLEIINELVHLVLENIADPRLQTHPLVTQSIANPVQ